MFNIYKEAQNNGIKLIFLDSIPDGFKPEKDYLNFIVGDSYNLGVLSARSLVKSIGGHGKVALLNWKNSMFTVGQRSRGAIDEFSKHQDIIVIDDIEFGDFFEIPDLIKDLIERHPDINGLWAVWDTPALEAIKVLNRFNKHVSVSTVDLNNIVAKKILSSSKLKSTAVDHPYYAGIAAALTALLDSQNIKHPSYTVTHAEIVTKYNVKELWQELYREPYDNE